MEAAVTAAEDAEVAATDAVGKVDGAVVVGAAPHKTRPTPPITVT